MIYTRAKAEKERFEFICKWCADRNIEWQYTDNWNKAAFAWAVANSP